MRARTWLALSVAVAVLLVAEPLAAGRRVDWQPAALTVVGTTLSAGAGRVVLHPVTHYLLPFYDNGSGGRDPALAETSERAFVTRDETFARMQAMGFDAVRVPLTAALFDDSADVYGLGPDGALARLQQIVASAKAHRLRVVLCWWDSLQQGSAFATGFRSVLPSIAAVHAGLGDDPAVLYEPWNEPHGLQAGQWQQLTTDTVSFFRRELGYRGVLLLDTDGWSYGLDPGAAAAVLDHDAELLDGAPQVVFATHRYARANACFCGEELASWEDAVGQYLTRFPVAGTEYGFTDGSGPPQPQWNTELLTHLEDVAVPVGLNAVGYFVWDWVDANSMTRSGGALNQHGEIVKESLDDQQ